MIEDASRGSHDDVRTLAQAFDLGSVSDPSIDRQATDPAGLAHGDHLVTDLVRQLPGGSHHEALGDGLVRIHRGDHRDAKGARLAAPRSGLNDEIPTAHHDGEHLLLDGHRFGPTELGDSAEYFFGKFAE